MLRHFTRLSKSVQKFGLWNGLQVYAPYFLHRLLAGRKWLAREMVLRGVSRPVWMRPGVSDWIVMERIFLDLEYDPLSPPHEAAMDRLQAAILARGKTPLVIDCGANIGLSAIWFAERYPQARIIALEPEPGNFAILEKNAANFPNILARCAAVSDRMSRVSLANSTDRPWSWQTREAEAGEVPAVTLQHIVAGERDAVLMAVKVDIEGFEVNLLRSATAWLEDLPLLVFEMHDWKQAWSGSGHAFFSALARQRRDYLVRGENIFAYAHSAFAPEWRGGSDGVAAQLDLAEALDHAAQHA
jgi:FkbM family methyltransferase